MATQEQAIAARDTSTELGATMQAVVQDRYGSAEVVRQAAIPRPTPSKRQVLIEVHAAGLDRGTVHLMTGRPRLLRLAFGLRRPRQPVLGRDVAGTVVEIGPDVTKFAVGDEVYGVAPGSFAEYAVGHEDKLARKPATASFDQAAVVPISGLTALQSLVDVGRVQPGQHVLITGASGGVGSYAVQLAKASGAVVTGVCSTAKIDHVRSLGADHVVDYTRADFADGARHYDLILDIAGLPSLARLRKALTPAGTLVLVGGEEGGDWTGGTIGRQLRARMVSPFSRQRLTSCLGRESGSDLARLTVLIDSGEVTPPLDRSYSLPQAQGAIRRLEAGDARGKTAISVRSSS
jgi:NADPH:quinone reductase-like Zn-dependent oxidoreductase